MQDTTTEIMPPSLLADLTLMLASSPEDVATRALELILARSPRALSALDRLLCDLREGRTAPVSRWASQVVGADRARTDLQGFGAGEETIVILENKFWAGLTDNQPATYLGRLTHPHGVLLFVVPRTRVSLIANELALRTPAPFGPYVRLPGDQDRLVSRSPDGRTLAVLSWDNVLTAIETALEAAEEFDNLADLRQLISLVRKMDDEGFLPLAASQLTGDAPRLILNLCELTDGAIQEVLLWPFANRRGLRASAGKGWYGHYFRLHGFCCQLIVSASRWRTPGRSPVWLRISDSHWGVPTTVRALINTAISDPSWVDEDRSRGWEGYWMPLPLLEGREREPVVADLVRQIRLVAEALAPAALTGVALAPPEADGTLSEAAS